MLQPTDSHQPGHNISYGTKFSSSLPKDLKEEKVPEQNISESFCNLEGEKDSLKNESFVIETGEC